MMSPFDEAAHRPIMNSPAKKKWFPSSNLSSSPDGYIPPLDVESRQQPRSGSFSSSMVEGPPTSSSFDIDLVCDVSPVSSEGGGKKTTTSSRSEQVVKRLSSASQGLVNSAAEHIRRLSWRSIETFDTDRSTFEDLVEDVGRQHTQKTRIYSALVSLGIILIFCYLINALFMDQADHDESSSAAREYSPQVKIPSVISSLVHHP